MLPPHKVTIRRAHGRSRSIPAREACLALTAAGVRASVRQLTPDGRWTVQAESVRVDGFKGRRAAVAGAAMALAHVDPDILTSGIRRRCARAAFQAALLAQLIGE